MNLFDVLPYRTQTYKNVRFNEKVVCVYEDIGMHNILREARSEYPTYEMRKADRNRQERLLKPIFSTAHREKIYRRLMLNNS